MRAVKVMLVVLSMIVVCSVAGAETFRFTVSVDNRPYDAANKARWEWLLDEMADKVGDEGVFHIMPGDIDPPEVTDASLKMQFAPDVVIWYPVVGNHEAETADDMTWIRSAFSTLPYVVNGGPVGCETTTYSFDYGNAHFVAINEYYNGTSDTGTNGDVVDALYNWLADDLANNTKPAVFVIGHEPAYPQLAHVGDSLDLYPANRDRFWKLLNDEKVIAYLCGHTHYYSALQQDQTGDYPCDAFTWQIDCGNAGNPREPEQTFIDITVTDTQVIFDTWRGTQGVSFNMTETWTVNIPAPPDKAYNPSPGNGAGDVGINVDLSWSGPFIADTYDVYFGTNPEPGEGEFQDNQMETTYVLWTLANDTTYYWRIDVVEADGTTVHTGDLWSFTTVVAAPGQASIPSPADTATDVSITADLSWTAGAGATEHYVYLWYEVDLQQVYVVNGDVTTDTTFDPGLPIDSTTYNWRIDEKNAGGTTTGEVWSFTTAAAPSQASDPQPPDGTLAVLLDTDLGWTAGSDTTSHDVYFGVEPETLVLVSDGQMTTTYDPGPLDSGTTYYWVVDEVGPGGVTPGPLWIFTTVALPWTDGFESGDLATGGWVTSGLVQVRDDAATGIYAVRTNRAASLEKAISTSGFGSITVSFMVKTFGMDSGEFLYVEWSQDGTNWDEIDTTANGVTQWTSKIVSCSGAAEDNADFRVRFRSNANKNREYVFIDDVQISGIPLAPDDTAPSPDPMTWAIVPYATGENSIAMAATIASDLSGVEYYFTNVTVTGHDSGWQDNPTYEDTGLDPATPYAYTVKARDKSANQNVTTESEAASATTEPEDITPPSPDPMTWVTAPYATGSRSVSMTATTATDDSGVEYYFACIAGGGNDSGWQDSATYEDTGLSPNTEYTYTVQARDKSPGGNLTAVSSAASATTPDAPVTDEVTIVRADYRTRQGVFTVQATSSKGGVAVLTVVGYGTMTYNTEENLYTFRETVADPGGTVTVTSSLGGSDTVSVTYK